MILFIHSLEKESANVRQLPGYIHSLAINESASKLVIGYTNVEGVHVAFVDDPCGGQYKFPQIGVHSC
jgi:hypothetical protein